MPGRRRRRIAALLSVAAALAAAAPSDAAAPVPRPPVAEVSVDFARPLRARSVVGLLHGIDARLLA